MQWTNMQIDTIKCMLHNTDVTELMEMWKPEISFIICSFSNTAEWVGFTFISIFKLIQHDK